ncbi:MAG: hypothetical protein QOH04_2997 [Sphingomonadales bacterium]|jgi:hypothetical protein|nr:hypothetical protein [Sphingomonadales bacterium]MEA3037210.1 hypothetical protein [Sphingomonadales bacterium]
MDPYAAETGGRPRRSWLAVLFLPVVAFAAGLAAMGYVLGHWSTGARWLGLGPAVPAAPAAVEPPPAPQPQLIAAPPEAPKSGERLVIDPETTRRVSALEQRLSQIDFQSRAAVGNADRAEALLVAFAARRALDRGVGLGYLETMLRQRFASTQPQAVATVLTVSRQPVTLQQLQAELQDLSPRLAGGGPNQSWWQAIRTEMGGLITIRREGSPSTLPDERLRRAQQSLQAGQADVALVEVLRLPGRANATAWVEKARRYVAARQALDTIETAALMEPPQPLPAARPAPQPAKPKA